MGRRRKIEEVEGYLKLTVKVDRQISAEELAFIRVLNHSLSPQDLKFSIEGDLVCAYLASLDPDSFHAILKMPGRRPAL